MKQQRTKCVYNQHQKRYRAPIIIHDEILVTAAQFKPLDKYIVEMDKRLTDVNMAVGDKLWISWKGKVKD